MHIYIYIYVYLMYYISHHTVAVLETTVYVNLLLFFLLHLVVTGFNFFEETLYKYRFK